MEKISKSNEGQKLENELVEFIDSEYEGTINGKQVSTYVDRKFGGDINSAIMFLATKKTQQARDTAKVLMCYQAAKETIKLPSQKQEEPQKDKRWQPTREIKRVNVKKLTGYERFEFLCGKAKIPLADARFSDDELPVISVSVMKGLPRHPTDDFRIVIPKKYLTDESREKLRDADTAEVKILEVNKNNIYVDLVKAHVKPKVEPRYIIATISYDKYQGVFIEAKDTKKRISVPRDILSKLIGKKGAWKMQVLKEADDFIHVLPIEATPEFDPEPERFMAIVKFDDRMGIRIDAPGKDKRITVPKGVLSSLMDERGAWQMKVLKEGPDYIHALPMEKLRAEKKQKQTQESIEHKRREKGISKKEEERQMETLLSEGKLSWG